MKTVGELLKLTRLERRLTLEEVVRATKIKKEFLTLIEANQFSGFASAVTAKGFIKNYAEFLGLSSSDLLAVFRRDSTPVKKRSFKFSFFQPVNRLNLTWTPKLTLVVGIGMLLLLVLAYLWFSYVRLNRNPQLIITNPPDGIQVSEDRIIVSGRADPQALVKINNNLVSLSARGEFNHELTLFLGENVIIVEVESKFGRKTVQQRTVNFKSED